jgi:hypothetical protein
MQAPFVLLSVGQQGHDNQSHYDASGYEVLHHACHSTAQWATTAQMMVTKGRGPLGGEYRAGYLAEFYPRTAHHVAP